MSPYVVTTTTHNDPLADRAADETTPNVSHLAVATLEEVRNLPEVEGWDTARCTTCGHFRDEHASGWCAGCDNGGHEPICREWKPDPLAEPFLALPDFGGTIGPLPDGTVIEVEHIGWGQLARDAGVSVEWLSEHGITPEIVSAYNAKKGIP